jgi:hypothetical protein
LLDTGLQFLQNGVTQANGIALAASGVLDDPLRNNLCQRVAPVSQL